MSTSIGLSTQHDSRLATNHSEGFFSKNNAIGASSPERKTYSGKLVIRIRRKFLSRDFMMGHLVRGVFLNGSICDLIELEMGCHQTYLLR